MTIFGRPRACRVALTTAALVALNLLGFSAAAPPVQASGHQAAPTAPGGSIDLRGGDASASLVCGNVADAQAYAEAHHLLIQRNDCHPEATGGDIELHDVQISIRADAVHASDDNQSLAELATSGGTATSQTTCVSTGARSGRGSARNHCWSRARGGRLELRDVTFVSHQARGETRKLVRSLFMRGTEGRVRTRCGRQEPTGQDPRDDCLAEGVGGVMDLRSVDVTRADGTVSSNVRVSVRGGNADASVYCFNVVRPGTQARQSNTCSATSRGGQATLRHVTIHVYAQSGASR